MIINNYIRNHYDRWYHNFLIEYEKNHCKLMPLFDFEYSFLQYDEELDNAFKFDIIDENTKNYIRNDDQFQKILYLTMDLDMKKILEKLFEEYPVIMTEDEQDIYESIIKTKKDEIKRFGLIK